MTDADSPSSTREIVEQLKNGMRAFLARAPTATFPHLHVHVITMEEVSTLLEALTASMERERAAEKLAEALRKIKGGHLPNASTLAVNGDWRGLYEGLQGIARTALSEFDSTRGKG